MKKIGWFGWTFIVVAALTVIGSGVFFSNLFGIGISDMMIGDDKGNETEVVAETDSATEPENEKTVKKVKEIQDTVGKDHQQIGEFVSDMHDFYNETTGYGGISSLDWDRQTEKAAYSRSVIDELLPEVSNEALKTDLQYIKNLALQAEKERNSDQVRKLHRMFHDLDIALNDYDGYDKIWGVTKTLDKIS